MNRGDFQQIAEERLQDAAALLTEGRWSGAYYMAGYAVECALKAVIAKRTIADDFPARDAAKLYTHNLRELLGFAGLGTANGSITAPGISVRCSAFWDIVKLWKEVARYESKTQQQAEQLVEAIDDPTD
ncbi:MAG: HEPN domain-containing protein [Akkermansiaceae bacterium]|nr:HEPN domain-containing protein [Armatimonadota bacterium]